jgi:hypothetical protein
VGCGTLSTVANEAMHGRKEGFRWLDVAAAAVITAEALAVLFAISRMGWASRVDDLGRTTFADGPRRLLVWAASVSAGLSLVLVVARWRWIRGIRWALLGTAVLTAAAAITVYLSSIYDANTTTLRQTSGPTETSIASGAVLGIPSAGVIVLVAVVGLMTSYDARTQPSAALPSSVDSVAPSSP